MLAVVVMVGSQASRAAEVAGSDFNTTVAQGAGTIMRTARSKTSAFGKTPVAATLASCSQAQCGDGRPAGAPSLEEAQALFNAARMPSAEEMHGRRWGEIAVISKERVRYNEGGFILDRYSSSDGSTWGVIADVLTFKSVPNVLTGKKYLGVRETVADCPLSNPDCRDRGYAEASLDSKEKVLCFRNPNLMSCRISAAKGLLVCREHRKNQRENFIIFTKVD